MILSIETKPIFQSKQYFGKIYAADLEVFTDEDGTIPFKLEAFINGYNEENPNGEVHRYNFLLKQKNYTSVRGKIKAILIERIEKHLLNLNRKFI